MRTRSSSNLVGNSSSNPTTSNPRRRNRRRSNQRVEPFTLEESPVVTMADQRTMAELLRAPTEGYAEAIVVPPILAEHFELKHSLINKMTSDQFFGLEKDNPHDHIRWFNKITSTIKYKDVSNSAIKLMLFPFSLAGAARRWLEKEPLCSILTWEDLEICTPVGITRDVFVLVGKFEYSSSFHLVEGDIIKNLLNLDKTKDLPPYHDNPLSGIPTLMEPETKSSSSSPTLTSIEESDLIWEEFEAYLASDSFPPGNSNPSSPLPPFHNSLSGSTTSSSPSLPISETSDYSLEEFADELALITFPPGNDDLPFDAESDLREIEYLLNHDPIKEMDSILEDSVDKNSPDDNLVDTISEMFTDEHALDYSSPPLWDDYDDELFDLETVNDDTYDDPFDSKEEKIKDSKILIDELDPPRSSDFLPFLECDLVFYEDFSEVDALPSTNNEDKVFNPGILIHENHFEVTNHATMEKNVKKLSNASLILEDFNPPLYELPFHKEVPGLGALLSFSFENEENVFNPRILTSKGVHTSLLSKLSHRGTKAFKVIKILESPMEIFPCSYGKDIRILDVPCLHFYPP
ncbi:hypothetical protein Tco_0233309 [Tanacetum coccineum]